MIGTHCPQRIYEVWSGFKETEVKAIANWICDILDDIKHPAVIERVKAQAAELRARSPVYGT